ncbi:GNAT family N-acetyltransferase [bacterium]|nr:GNAT family N-acetyltransferase [bacterium]
MIRLSTGFSWDSPEAEAVRRVRITVFVEEQQVPGGDEFDSIDDSCVHALILSDGKPVATGRLFAFEGGGRIGRMAVMREARGLGYGRLIVEALLVEGRLRGWKRFVLDAQVHAIGFYERCGFHVIGEEHLDCNIPHRLMERVER